MYPGLGRWAHTRQAIRVRVRLGRWAGTRQASEWWAHTRQASEFAPLTYFMLFARVTRLQGGRKSHSKVCLGKYTKRFPEAWASAEPFLGALWKAAQEELGAETAADLIERCPEELRLGGVVPWPSVQLNRNTSLGYHLDPNDVAGQWR